MIKSAYTQYLTVHAAELMHVLLLYGAWKSVHANKPVVGLTTTNCHCQLIISMQRINHAAKPVQCSTLCILVQAGTHRGLAGGGKKLLLAGSSQQGFTPGKGVRGGLR